MISRNDERKVGVTPTPIKCDNQGALKLIKSGVFKAMIKQINVKYHHSHDEDKRGIVDFSYIASKDNIADILTYKTASAPKAPRASKDDGNVSDKIVIQV
jgi:hypothetical protein